MSLHSNRKTLMIRGWRVGFQKVEFTKMLQRELGLRLSEAKGVTDRVLMNELIELPISDLDLKRVTAAAVELGAIVLVEEHEGACR